MKQQLKTKTARTTHSTQKTKINYAVIPLALLVLISGIGIGSVIAASPSNGNGNGNNGDDDNQVSSLSTTGIATMSINPNKLEIYLGVETQSESAQECQQENARIINDIRAALISSGISADSINTYRYNIYPIREYNDWHSVDKIIGYRTIHVLKIESENVNIAGSIIDTGVENGANKIENVVFTLTNEEMNQKRTELLADAAISAREKADTIAGALGVTVIKVLHASEGYSYYTPYRYNTYALAETAAMGSMDYPTQITPGDIQISATVTVNFEIA